MANLDEKLSAILDIESEIELQEKEMREGKKKTTTTSMTVDAPISGNPPTEEKFGLATYVAKDLEVVELDDEADTSDKALARAALRNVLTVTTTNLDGLLKLAQATEHPRAFEVAAVFAKTIIDAAGKLDDMVESKKKKAATNEGAAPTNQFNQQNNIVMSAEDAMKMIRNMTKNPINQTVENNPPDNSPSAE